MATPREHMLADLAHLFAEEGEAAENVMIGGSSVRAIPHPEECVAGEFEGLLVHRRRYLFLANAMTARLGEEKEIEGKRWRVVTIANPPGLIDVTLERNSA